MQQLVGFMSCSSYLEKLKKKIREKSQPCSPIERKKDVLDAILQPGVNRVKPFTHMASDEYEAIIRQFHRLTNDHGL